MHEQIYIDEALDDGTDVYFDCGKNELMLHVPPGDSPNSYIFTRVNGERAVHRNPTIAEIAEWMCKICVEE